MFGGVADTDCVRLVADGFWRCGAVAMQISLIVRVLSQNNAHFVSRCELGVIS